MSPVLTQQHTAPRRVPQVVNRLRNKRLGTLYKFVHRRQCRRCR